MYNSIQTEGIMISIDEELLQLRIQEDKVKYKS